jgi:hypothetical protein
MDGYCLRNRAARNQTLLSSYGSEGAAIPLRQAGPRLTNTLHAPRR